VHRSQNRDNPFDWINTEILDYSNFSVTELAQRFSLSESSAKIIWITCPKFQEDFCRNRIIASKARGGNTYGNKIWLGRRFDLLEDELEAIFSDIWDNPNDQISTKFLEIMNVERIANSQLTSDAKRELAELMTKYG
jgi:hypothetical protein